MKREDFVAGVGYMGNTAMVDGKTKKRHGKRSADELLEKGLYRAAFSAALYDDDTEAMERILAAVRSAEGADYRSADDLKRLFGVDGVPESVGRVKVL